jgi:hypothetical protein
LAHNLPLNTDTRLMLLQCSSTAERLKVRWMIKLKKKRKRN